MKRIICMILAAVMLCGVFSACSTLEDDDKGAIIDIYLTEELFNFDPALAYTDDSMVKVLSVLFEGLTRLDSKGNWEKAMMDDYKYEVDEEKQIYKLTIDLKSSAWSDGRTVQAADFVYAWKRVLDPEFRGDAAALLYDIKNARTAKFGDCSIDDVGLASIDTYTLEILFEYDIDVDAFLRTVASVALVPLREDVIASNSLHWAQKTSSIVCNGPFALKELNYGDIMRIERNAYYFRNVDENERLDKYVIPWRVVTHYAYGDAATQFSLFEEGQIFYVGEIPLSERARVQKNAHVEDESATHTYLFNTENELFKDARVRRALSMAIDRNEIVNIVTYAKPATGLIPYGVVDANNKGEFRNVGGAILNTSADVEGAKALLREAGVSGGTFTITVKDHEQDVAIAEYVQKVWQGLGFNVMINALTGTRNRQLEKIYNDNFNDAYEAGNFDVIAIDMNMLTREAYGNLAIYATDFSGGGVDMRSKNYDVKINRLGYQSDEYDELIEKAFAEKDSAARAAILHDAESKLLDDMPVMPLIFLQDYYMINTKILSGESTEIEGYRNFNKLKMKNYMAYKKAILAAEEAAAEETMTVN